jgi:hypothetical protein
VAVGAFCALASAGLWADFTAPVGHCSPDKAYALDGCEIHRANYRFQNLDAQRVEESRIIIARPKKCAVTAELPSTL